MSGICENEAPTKYYDSCIIIETTSFFVFPAMLLISLYYVRTKSLY